METWNVFFAERTPNKARHKVLWVVAGSKRESELMDMSDIHQIEVLRMWTGVGTEADARRAARCHWCFNDFGGVGSHESVAQKLFPNSDPLRSLAVDATAEDFIALADGPPSESWAVDQAMPYWAMIPELTDMMEPSASMVLRSLGALISDPDRAPRIARAAYELYESHRAIASQSHTDKDVVLQLIPRAARAGVTPAEMAEGIATYPEVAEHLNMIPALYEALIPRWCHALIEQKIKVLAAAQA